MWKGPATSRGLRVYSSSFARALPLSAGSGFARGMTDTDRSGGRSEGSAGTRQHGHGRITQHGNGSTVRSGHPVRNDAHKKSQQPRGSSPGEQMYVVTILTDKNLHSAMNNLRQRYFPPRLNKLEAHITLFHALPASRLETDILPAMEQLASSTTKFELAATTPFKLKRGIAIGMPKDHGGYKSRQLHTDLVGKWKPFLSQQDLGFQAHYTVMNKVDEESEVDGAMKEVQDSFRAVFGTAEGLSLYKYHHSGWEWIKNLSFQAA